MAIEKQVEDVNSPVKAIHNKPKSSLHGTINYNYVPNSFELSGFALNGSLLSKKEWDYLLSKKAWKKLAKVLYLYRDDLDRFFLYVPPDKVKDVSQSCEISGYFKVVKEEIHFYKCKDGSGWTDFLPLADESLAIFHKLTINLSPKTKIKFARIYDYKLVGIGIALSTFVQLIIS